MPSLAVMYLGLKWLHILLAVVALGANITYGVWLARARRDPQHLGFALRGIKFLDDRIANPAYVLLLVTGLAMMFVGPIPHTTPWVVTSLALYGAVVLVAIVGYSPTLRGQVNLVEAGLADTSEYAALNRRATIFGAALAVLVVAITALMVFKPPLWAA